MNRRQFFGMTAAAVAIAGLPAFVLPEKTIFLPPRFGWHPSKLVSGYMREVTQYLINVDALAYRYDAIGRDIWGREHQVFVDAGYLPSPEMAAILIEDRFRHDGLIAVPVGQSREFRLALPRNAYSGRYV